MKDILIAILIWVFILTMTTIVSHIWKTHTRKDNSQLDPVDVTVYVDNEHMVDSLKRVIRNQDRYILMLENQNKVLGHYNSQR